jgi:putative sigma-54 modulation protein
MKIEYTGRHIEVTPALRSHAEEHFGRIDHVFAGKPIKAHLTIEVERGRHRSEAVVNWRNDVLTAETTSADMYRSIASTIEKIEKQALKLKKKVIDRSHRAVKAGKLAPPEVADVAPSPSSPKIIKSRRYKVKPVSAEEAAMLLEDDENQFLVFRDSDTERVSIIYKRTDGNYGLIEP